MCSSSTAVNMLFQAYMELVLCYHWSHPHSTYAQRGFSEKLTFACKGEGVPANVYVRNTITAMQPTTPKIQ